MSAYLRHCGCLDAYNFKVYPDHPERAGSDLDWIQERNGRFAVIESKCPGECVSMGQAIMLGRLAEKFGFFVVLAQNGGHRLSSGARSFRPDLWRRIMGFHHGVLWGCTVREGYTLEGHIRNFLEHDMADDFASTDTMMGMAW